MSFNGNSSLATQSASTQPNSRSLTIGTYRGNNSFTTNGLYTWTVPASHLVTGSNALTISPISGSSDLGGYLSAAYAFDCIELTV